MQHVRMTEAEQLANAKAVRARIMNPTFKASDDRRVFLERKVGQLEEQIAGFKKMMKDYEEDAIKAEHDRADYQAIILEQTKRICDLEGVQFVGKSMRRPVREIAEGVLEDFPGVTWDMIIGRRRSQHLIKPRHLCMYAVHMEREDLSYPQIGKIFGGRDHTTVIHAVNKFKKGEQD